MQLGKVSAILGKLQLGKVSVILGKERSSLQLGKVSVILGKERILSFPRMVKRKASKGERKGKDSDPPDKNCFQIRMKKDLQDCVVYYLS